MTTALIQRIDPSELGLPNQPVIDTHEVNNSLAQALEQGCNVLSPLTQINYIPPDHVIQIRVIYCPLEGGWDNGGRSNGTWYQVDGGKIALHRAALEQLASAAGLSDVPELCSVVNVEGSPYYWRATHTVKMKTIDGTDRLVKRSVGLDLRDGSSELGGASSKRIANMRKFGERQAETKAASRAIRAALGIKGGYTKQEALRPFVLPTLVWRPDMSDPEIKRMVAAKQLGVINELFGAQEQSRIERLNNTPAAQGAPPCETCGVALTDEQANRSIDAVGAPLCAEHMV